VCGGGAMKWEREILWGDVAHICKDSPNLNIICLRRMIEKEKNSP
jgi:hypothetical protein